MKRGAINMWSKEETVLTVVEIHSVKYGERYVIIIACNSSEA